MSPATKPPNQFAYMLEREIVLELEALGIMFQAIDLGPEEFPALILPSGKALLIQSDDEGNGPGSIQWGGTLVERPTVKARR